jgi:CRP/FNR family transcriptional regulator
LASTSYAVKSSTQNGIAPIIGRTAANGGIIISRRWPVAEQIEDVPTKTFEPGDVIFREGDESQSEAYLVHEGTVEARRRVDGEERVLNTLVKGDLLGEVALFRDAPHSVSAIAVERVTLLVIQAHRLENMVRANPELAIGLIRQLARMAAGKV